MEKHVRTVLQSTFILLTLGIIVQVKAQPVVVGEIPSSSTNFIKSGDLVFFRAGDVLWRTDGTSGGTFSLKDGVTQQLAAREFNGNFFFVNNNNRELWRSDGTPSGTILLKTSSASNIRILDATGDYLFFVASDEGTGSELYRTNGTAGGTQLIRDINPGTANSNPFNAAAVGGHLFFAAYDGEHGIELWKSDGTSAGTAMIEDINPGAGNGIATGAFPPSFGVFSYNNRFFFTGTTPATGSEPWVSDGTETGTTLLKDLVPGPGSHVSISFKIQHDGFVYIQADPAHHHISPEEPDQLWKTSGTPASTVKVSDIGTDEGFANYYRVYKDQVHFFAWVEFLSSVLWKTDGTTATNYFDFYTQEGNVSFFEPANDYLLFYGDHQGHPTPFFRTDGTREGTEEFTRFKSGGYLRYPRDVTRSNDYVFYGDQDGLSDTGNSGEPYSEEDYFHLIQTDGVTTESMRTMFGVSTIGTDNITDYNGKVIFTTHDDRGETPENNPKRLWIYEPIDSPRDSATFTLVHAGTDTDVRRITEGATIVNPLNEPLNIRYNPITTPGSVVFKLNDVTVRTETAPPYSLAGDINGDYATWQGANPGSYTLTATPYSQAGGQGTAGESLTVDFIIEEAYGQPDPEECTASGTILREYWDNVSGNSVSSIPVNTTPTSTSQLTIFEGPTNIDTNYGARIRGYICPPTTGTYTFWIASNDNSELWLSTDDGPANKRRIAFVTGATNSREWSKYASQKSVAISLNAGQRYYIEALHKQGVGTDNAAVGWQLPDGAMERPIPGNRLSPFTSSRNTVPVVTIHDPDDGQTFTQPANVAINATATDSDGSVSKVEFFAGASKLGEDVTSPYSYVWQNAPVGNHTLTAKATDNGGSVGTSSPVTITVSGGACTASGTITRDYWAGVSGDHVSNVPVNSPPTSTNELTIFEGPGNIGDNYATRIRGYICPPVTGNYNFWIASNDHSELWLSTDDDPANKAMIAWVTGATAPREWNKFGSQRSPAKQLIQGQRYYIEALHKEGVGTDHISVGWTLPDGTLERPIPGSRLSLFEMNAARMASDDESTSGEKSLASQINIYPNPASSGDPELTISGFEGMKETFETEVEIINLTGEVVFTEKVSCGGDCSTYLVKLNKQIVSGLYLVNLRVNGTRFSKRLLVK